MATPDERSDLSLVQQVRAGDPRGFQTLVERYQRKVYTLAAGMLKDKYEAQDVAQEAFVRAFKSLDLFKGDSSFYTWLYRLTSNLCIDVIRRRKAHGGPLQELDDSIHGQLDPASAGLMARSLGSQNVNPQQAALRQELAGKIHQALEQLPEKHRAILLMREVDGMSYEELAEALEIPKGTVMSRLFHARLNMQKMLRDYLGLEENEVPGE